MTKGSLTAEAHAEGTRAPIAMSAYLARYYIAFEGLAIAVVAAALAVIWVLHLGPDISVDFLDYHLFIGTHASGDALPGSFFPAGVSSYLVPYANWPLAAMIGAGWPARWVGALLAVLQSLAALATWLVAMQLFPAATSEHRMCRVASVVLGLMGPLGLAAIGSSHVDLITAIPAVIGVAVLLKGLSAERTSLWVLTAGCCFGAATALKLTNATWALAAGVTVASFLFNRRGAMANLALLVAGGVAGFAAVYAPWGVQLWREFGNPFFPFADSAFSAVPKSDAVQPALLHRVQNFRDGLHQRFLAHGWREWLLRPLFMIDPTLNVYVEVRAPDLRFLVLFIVAPFAALNARRTSVRDPLMPLLLFLTAGWVFWMLVFGNGRYMLALSLAAGPALVACGHRVAIGKRSLFWVPLVVIVAVQGIFLAEGATFRWSHSAWQEHWIDASLPPEVARAPVTFVVLGPVSAGWMTQFVHPGSRFVQPFAMSRRRSDPRLDSRLATLLASQPLWAIFDYTETDDRTAKPVPETPAGMRPIATQAGVEVDFAKCLTGELRMGKQKLTVSSEFAGASTRRSSIAGYFFCPAHYRPDLKPDPVDATVELALDNLEKACPVQMPAGAAKTACGAGGCWRSYPSTDVFISINADGAATMKRFGGFSRPYLGQAKDLARSADKVNCHENFGKYVPWDPGASAFSKP